MDDLSDVIVESDGKEIKEKLIILLNFWALEWNWKTYKNEYFPIKAMAYYELIQFPNITELDPENSNKKRNDFIYWELKELGNFIIGLNKSLSSYPVRHSYMRISFIKKYDADKVRKERSNKFIKEIKEEPDFDQRELKIRNRLIDSDLEETIYFALKVYNDFCKIYEYLNSEFDSTIPINPLTKADKWGGTLPQAVLYHLILIKGGIEDRIDTTSIMNECENLAKKYGFKGWKRWSDFYNAIENKKKEVRSRDPFTYRDAEIVEKTLRENYPKRQDLIGELHNTTHPIYP
ncbi:hypothetical protein [Autumnicola musiva]|uniref:Uncharacterized protein n=1 Tax=Autumnicola musiva TaxID=3075589 RepID=A0ABU3D9V0_9FLAO|nr:hypothetical protein [Zunongwangia sp. F117]MDT0678313.1 hypothetical protein [Zunongwangia sp. F117]